MTQVIYPHTGFVYIWLDRKHGKFYIGSHMGQHDDGYVCSSSWMKQAYRLRREDFRREFLYFHNSDDRASLLVEETRWLQMIKPEELGSRYYNLKRNALGGIRTGTQKERLGKASRENWMKEEYRAKVPKAISEGWTPAHRARKAEQQRKAWTPERRAAHAEKLRQRWASGAYDDRVQEFDEDARRKMGSARRGKSWSATAETRAKMSASARRRANTPEYKESFRDRFAGKPAWNKGLGKKTEAL